MYQTTILYFARGITQKEKIIMRSLRIHGALCSCQKTGICTTECVLNNSYQYVKFKRETNSIIKNPLLFLSYFFCILGGEDDGQQKYL